MNTIGTIYQFAIPLKANTLLEKNLKEVSHFLEFIRMKMFKETNNKGIPLILPFDGMCDIIQELKQKCEIKGVNDVIAFQQEVIDYYRQYSLPHLKVVDILFSEEEGVCFLLELVEGKNIDKLLIPQELTYIGALSESDQYTTTNTSWLFSFISAIVIKK